VEKDHQQLNIKNNQHHWSSRGTFRKFTDMDFIFDSGMRGTGHTLGKFRASIPIDKQGEFGVSRCLRWLECLWAFFIERFFWHFTLEKRGS